MTRALLVFALLIAAAGCRETPVPAAGLTTRRLAFEPLEATVPDDARIEDRSIIGPDDGGVTLTCVTLHPPFAANTSSPCGSSVSIEPAYQICGDNCPPNKCWRYCELTLDDEMKSPDAQVVSHDTTTNSWIIESRRGALLGVVVPKTIEGTAWECHATARNRAELDEAERICSSVRAVSR